VPPAGVSLEATCEELVRGQPDGQSRRQSTRPVAMLAYQGLVRRGTHPARPHMLVMVMPSHESNGRRSAQLVDSGLKKDSDRQSY